MTAPLMALVPLMSCGLPLSRSGRSGPGPGGWGAAKIRCSWFFCSSFGFSIAPTPHSLTPPLLSLGFFLSPNLGRVRLITQSLSFKGKWA